MAVLTTDLSRPSSAALSLSFCLCSKQQLRVPATPSKENTLRRLSYPQKYKRSAEGEMHSAGGLGCNVRLFAG